MTLKSVLIANLIDKIAPGAESCHKAIFFLHLRIILISVGISRAVIV